MGKAFRCDRCDVLFRGAPTSIADDMTTEFQPLDADQHWIEWRMNVAFVFVGKQPELCDACMKELRLETLHRYIAKRYPVPEEA